MHQKVKTADRREQQCNPGWFIIAMGFCILCPSISCNTCLCPRQSWLDLDISTSPLFLLESLWGTLDDGEKTFRWNFTWYQWSQVGHFQRSTSHQISITRLTWRLCFNALFCKRFSCITAIQFLLWLECNSSKSNYDMTLRPALLHRSNSLGDQDTSPMRSLPYRLELPFPPSTLVLCCSCNMRKFPSCCSCEPWRRRCLEIMRNFIIVPFGCLQCPERFNASTRKDILLVSVHITKNWWWWRQCWRKSYHQS